MDACVCQCLKWVSFSSLRRPFFFLSLRRRFCQRQLASKSVSTAAVLIKQLFLSFHATFVLILYFGKEIGKKSTLLKTVIVRHSFSVMFIKVLGKVTTHSESVGAG